MRRILSLSLLILMLVTACGEKKAVFIEPVDFAATLFNELTFKDTLTEMEQDVIIKLLNVENIDAAAGYINSMATTECIMVLTAKDEEAAEVALGQVEAYIAALKEDTRDYQPDEVTRIENNAFVASFNQYVIFTISDVSQGDTSRLITDLVD